MFLLAACGSGDSGGGAADEPDAPEGETEAPVTAAEQEEEEPEEEERTEAEESAEEVAVPEFVTFGFVGPPSMPYVSHLAGLPELQEVADRHGFELRHSSYGSGVDLMAAIQGGEVTYSLTDATLLFNGVARGQNLVGVLNVFSGSQFPVFAAIQHQEERGTDIANFDGLTWAFTREGAAGEITGRILTESAGLEWEDQGRIATGSHPAILPAFVADRADIAATTADVVAKGIRDGDAYLVLNSLDPEGGFPFPETINPMTFDKAFADAYPEVTTELIAAELQGIFKISEASGDPDDVLEVLSAASDHPSIQEFLDANEEGFADIWALHERLFLEVDGLLEPAIEDSLAYTEAAGVELPADFDPDSALDHTFVPAAYELLGLPDPRG